MNYTQKRLTLGSLFDGSGGFPLAGKKVGIIPLWASEIEPFPILVTRKNIPEMEHIGDIKSLNGGGVEPVDVITFGSPCQDLSTMGKRQGLNGEKSSLFFEAIRVIREMREATNGKNPRWILWENVCGAFTSNRGEDFRVALESILKIKDAGLCIPVPESGRWKRAGTIVARGVSLAWRTLNARDFGLPQRRERIYLIADIEDECAAQILFDAEGVFADIDKDEKGTERTGSGAWAAGFRADESHKTFGIGYEIECAPCLCTSGTQSVLQKEGNDYIARRLTPDEYGKLQGFPEEWGRGLEKDVINDAELCAWRHIFDKHCEVYGIKRKTDKQIIKWLSEPHSDAAFYKMWGNGIALPCAIAVLKRVQERGTNGG